MVKSELQSVWQDEDLGQFQKMPIRIIGINLVKIQTGNIQRTSLIYCCWSHCALRRILIFNICEFHNSKYILLFKLSH